MAPALSGPPYLSTGFAGAANADRFAYPVAPGVGLTRFPIPGE